MYIRRHLCGECERERNGQRAAGAGAARQRSGVVGLPRSAAARWARSCARTIGRRLLARLARRWPQSLRTVVRLMLNTRPPDVRLVGSGAGLPLQRRLPRIDRTRATSRLPRAAGARGLGRDLGHHRPADRAGHVGPRRDLARRISSCRSPATAAARMCTGLTATARLTTRTRRNGVGGVLVVCSETTQQVLAARQLAAERDRLAQLFEQAPTFMALLHGPEHRFELANPGYMQLVGHRPVSAGPSPRRFRKPSPRAMSTCSTGSSQTARPIWRTARVRLQREPRRAGHRRFVDFVYQPIKDADGRVTGIFVHGADVTERAQADALLRESEARFRSALKAGRMGSWETDYSTMTRIWSAGRHGAVRPRPSRRARQGGRARRRVRRGASSRRQAPRGSYHELAATQDSFTAEYRIVTPDGTTRSLSGRGLVVARDADGKPKRLVSVMADVSEARRAEDLLRLERERFGPGA